MSCPAHKSIPKLFDGISLLDIRVCSCDVKLGICDLAGRRSILQWEEEVLAAQSWQNEITIKAPLLVIFPSSPRSKRTYDAKLGASGGETTDKVDVVYRVLFCKGRACTRERGTE